MRLLQQNAPPRTSIAAGQQTAVPVAAATRPRKASPRKRQRAWYLGLLVLACGVTGAELVGRSLIWAENTGRRLISSPIQVRLTNPWNLAYSRGLSRVASFQRGAAGSTLSVVDAASRKVLWARTDIPRADLALNPQGALLFAGRYVLDASSGAGIRKAPAPLDARVRWSQDGQVAAWITPAMAKQESATLEIWQASQNRRQSLNLPLASRNYQNLTVSPDGQWVLYTCHSMIRATSSQGQVGLVSVSRGTTTRLQAAGSVFLAPVFSPDSKSLLINNRVYPDIYATREVSYLQVWSTSTGQLSRELRLDKPVYEVLWSEDSRLIATHGEYRYEVFDSVSGENLWTSPAHAGWQMGSLTADRQLNILTMTSEKGTPDIQLGSQRWDLSQVIPP